jgi:hypothetical protein
VLLSERAATHVQSSTWILCTRVCVYVEEFLVYFVVCYVHAASIIQA